MKFFLEFVACCGSRAWQQQQPPPEESGLLMVPEARLHVGRKRGRERRCGLVDWRPSLSSISEDNVLPERNPQQPPRRNLKIKGGASITRRDRAPSSHHNVVRRPSVPAVLPTFSPTPFLFL